METISNAITDFYIRKNYIPQEKKEIYSYGFKLIIADIINFSIVMLSGAVLGKFIESMLFLVTLCGIRQFSGGFHAKTFGLCRLSMLITFFGVILTSWLITFVSFSTELLLILNIICIVLIYTLAPIRHPNKTLTVEQKRRNKIKATITSLILSVASSVLLLGKIDLGVIISITLAAVVILMIIGLAVQKGGN